MASLSDDQPGHYKVLAKCEVKPKGPRDQRSRPTSLFKVHALPLGGGGGGGGASDRFHAISPHR